ncbi:hypothetical protein D3C86_1489680 [compost metagenome]
MCWAFCRSKSAARWKGASRTRKPSRNSCSAGKRSFPTSTPSIRNRHRARLSLPASKSACLAAGLSIPMAVSGTPRLSGAGYQSPPAQPPSLPSSMLRSPTNGRIPPRLWPSLRQPTVRSISSRPTMRNRAGCVSYRSQPARRTKNHWNCGSSWMAARPARLAFSSRARTATSSFPPTCAAP